MPANLHHTTVKTLIRRHDRADAFMTSRFSFSPYRACEHGCVYCDGRAERYYVAGEFDRDIVVRDNAPDLLRAELPRLRERGIVCIGSGISDPYQPAEADARIISRCAGILAASGRPVAVLTKSSLAERDLDSWREVNARSRFRLCVSLTFADDELRKAFEPGSSSVRQRLSLLKTFKDASCVVGVLAMPFLPFITDTEEHLRAFAGLLKPLDLDFVMPAGLTLRPGVQKETFLAHIRRTFPDLEAGYLDIYRENKPSGAVCAEYQRELGRRLTAFSRDLSVPPLVPHAAYRDVTALYDEVSVLLAHMAELYSFRGIDTRKLRASSSRFGDWVAAERKSVARRRRRSYAEIEDKLRFLCASGGIKELLGNEKLAGFVRRVVVDRGRFDYIDLTLKE